jgi:anti-sigma factor RsiW
MTTCLETRDLLDAFVDDELDLRSGAEVAAHVASCSSCDAERAGLLGVRRLAREQLSRRPMPPGLEARLSRRLRQETGLRRAGWAVAVTATAAAAAALALVAIHGGPSAESLRDQVVDAHVRSLMAAHLTDVASTDRHTVKPWFQGRLDFAVPVRDFSSDGFTLAGGRLDYLGGRPVASLVYRLRQHAINVFVWPEPGANEAPVRESTRGYSVWRWRQDGFAWWMVSDAASEDAGTLVRLLREP